MIRLAASGALAFAVIVVAFGGTSSFSTSVETVGSLATGTIVAEGYGASYAVIHLAPETTHFSFHRNQTGTGSIASAVFRSDGGNWSSGVLWDYPQGTTVNAMVSDEPVVTSVEDPDGEARFHLSVGCVPCPPRPRDLTIVALFGGMSGPWRVEASFAGAEPRILHGTRVMQSWGADFSGPGVQVTAAGFPLSASVASSTEFAVDGALFGIFTTDAPAGVIELSASSEHSYEKCPCVFGEAVRRGGEYTFQMTEMQGGSRVLLLVADVILVE